MTNLISKANRLARLAELRAEIRALLDEKHRHDAQRSRELIAEAEAQLAAMRQRTSRHKAGGFSVLPLVICLALGSVAGAVYVGHAAELRQREAVALRCAMNSDGADSSIADCYASRDLPLPEGI